MRIATVVLNIGANAEPDGREFTRGHALGRVRRRTPTFGDCVSVSAGVGPLGVITVTARATAVAAPPIAGIDENLVCRGVTPNVTV